jgi:8-oxo-dGTP diphosphatase
MHRSLHDLIPIFGEERRTSEPRVRECAYVVLSTKTDGRAQIAVVKAREDILLPGGGLDPGEDHSRAAIREAEEECALRVVVRQVLGDAIQYVGGRASRPVVEKRGRFFAADIEHPVSRTPDHEVLWLSPEEAGQTLTNHSHRWAVRRWQRLNT